jgi:four helix bundle protein
MIEQKLMILLIPHRVKQQARVLVRKIYEVTKSYPFNKDLRLSGQIQAAGTSVMSNIPEGFIRRSDKEFVQFLFIAMSSSAEGPQIKSRA